MDDDISRQSAIEAALTFIVEYCGAAFDDDMQKMLCERLDALPSAEPEIIRCKDCMHYVKDHGWNRIEYTVCSLSPLHKVLREPNDFCSRAKRKTDEKENI